MTHHFRDNLSFAIHERFGASYKDKKLADVLNVDRSTVSRLRNSDAPPGRDRIETLSRYFGIPAGAWGQPPEAFVAEYRRCTQPGGEAPAAGSVRVSMGAIDCHRHLWAASFAIHRGQYIAYWKASDAEQFYTASLLEVVSQDHEGISFELFNPYIRDEVEKDDARSWQYLGKVYPVAEYLYFFGEQRDNNYELLTMIMTASPIAPPDLLLGCLTGIHVKDGRKQIAVNIAVVLAFVRKPVVDWWREVGERLGKLPAGKVPARIRKLIDPLPGIVTLGA